MKQIISIFLLLFLLNPIFGQKLYDIPETIVIQSFIESLPNNLEKLELKDLRTSADSLNIRIWRTHDIFTLNYRDSTFSDYKIYTSNEEFIFKTFNVSNNISQNIFDSLLVEKLIKLENEEYRGIDESYIFIELSTKSKYKIVSYWSPESERSNDCKTVVQILDMIHKTIDSRNLHDEFLNSLPPGNYRWGMTGVRIDKFLEKGTVKSDFYSQAEEKIKIELGITEETNHWDYPLIFINNIQAKIADLNIYTDQGVSKFEILKPDNKLLMALYGTSGSNGVVILETK